MRHGISAVIIAKNEAVDLSASLSAWSEVCDQGILVNDQSTDQTADIARDFGYTVINSAMGGNGFSGLRNEGLAAVKTDLALVFDADERPSDDLLAGIRRVMAEPADSRRVYRIRRTNYVLGQEMKYGRWGRDRQVRLFNPAIRYSGLVHETPHLSVNTEIVDLPGSIQHATYATWQEYGQKMRQYACMEAQRRSAEGTRITPAYLLMRLGANLLLRQAFRDGILGLKMCGGDVWYDTMVLRQQKSYWAESHTLITEEPACT